MTIYLLGGMLALPTNIMMQINQLIRMTILTVFLSLFIAVIGISANAFQFSKEEKSQLKAGETVIRFSPTSGQKGYYGGSGYTVIDAPLDTVWNAILSWRNYPFMFPNTEQCVPVSRKGNKTLVKMVIGHPLANVQYYLNANSNESQKTLQFKLVTYYPHDLDMLKGFWRLFPQPGGRTLVAYVVSAKVPAGLVTIVGPKLAHEAITMLLSIPGDLRKWVEKK